MAGLLGTGLEESEDESTRRSANDSIITTKNILCCVWIQERQQNVNISTAWMPLMDIHLFLNSVINAMLSILKKNGWVFFKLDSKYNLKT